MKITNHSFIFSKKKKIAYFINFYEIIKVFMQENRAFKKYKLWEKFILQQFVANFDDFWRNNSVFMQKLVHLKNISEQSLYFDN